MDMDLNHENFKKYLIASLTEDEDEETARILIKQKAPKRAKIVSSRRRSRSRSNALEKLDEETRELEEEGLSLKEQSEQTVLTRMTQIIQREARQLKSTKYVISQLEEQSPLSPSRINLSLFLEL